MTAAGLAWLAPTLIAAVLAFWSNRIALVAASYVSLLVWALTNIVVVTYEDLQSFENYPIVPGIGMVATVCILITTPRRWAVVLLALYILEITAHPLRLFQVIRHDTFFWWTDICFGLQVLCQIAASLICAKERRARRLAAKARAEIGKYPPLVMQRHNLDGTPYTVTCPISRSVEALGPSDAL